MINYNIKIDNIVNSNNLIEKLIKNNIKYKIITF